MGVAAADNHDETQVPLLQTQPAEPPFKRTGLSSLNIYFIFCVLIKGGDFVMIKMCV
jgi:hypothetical protein